MNLSDIKLGDILNYYWHDISGHLHHKTVTAIKLNAKSVRVRTIDADGIEFRAEPSELDNRQVELFDNG